VLTAKDLHVNVICEGGVVRSQHPPVPIGVDMNDLSAIARFHRGQATYMPGPRQFEPYHRLVGPRFEAQQMYSVCPDSQPPPSYQVCLSLSINLNCLHIC